MRKIKDSPKETWIVVNCAGCGKKLKPHLTMSDAKIYCSDCCCPMCVQEYKLAVRG
jgi:hypothetical protein